MEGLKERPQVEQCAVHTRSLRTGQSLFPKLFASLSYPMDWQAPSPRACGSPGGEGSGERVTRARRRGQGQAKRGLKSWGKHFIC